MADITVEANGSYPDQVGARSIYIDAIENDATLIMQIEVNGEIETHEIKTTSKFISPDFIIDEIKFINKTGANVDVTYHVSTLIEYSENRNFGNVLIANAIPAPATLATKPDIQKTVGQHLILAANPNRKEVIIQTRSANTQISKIGDATTSANNGIEMIPGATLILETQAAIYAYSSTTHTYNITETVI